MGVAARGPVVGLHEVGAREVLVRAEHADEVLSGHLHELGQARARAHEDRVEAVLRKEGVELARAAHEEVELEAHAHGREDARLGADQVLGQAELGDAVYHDAAGLLEGLVDDDLVPLPPDVHGAGEARGTRADDGDPLAGRVAGRGSLGAARGALPIGDETLEAADLHGLFHRLQRLAEGAGRLALALLRADAAADRGQEVRALDDPRGLGEVALLDLGYECGDVHLDGAARDAGFVLATEAALRLEQGLGLVVALRDLLHVVVAHPRVLAGHVLHAYAEAIARRDRRRSDLGEFVARAGSQAFLGEFAHRVAPLFSSSAAASSRWQRWCASSSSFL